MKRLIATRKLKRTCEGCGKSFKKGEIYYKQRKIYFFEDGYGSFKVLADEFLICPKCKYKKEQRLKRYKEFQKVCVHPERFIETEWSYIPGECVKEPDYDHCLLCGGILY